jgi:SAM-dependent methyltransferase
MSPCNRIGLNSGERIVAKEPCAVYKCHTQRYQLAQKYVRESSDVLDFGCGIGYGSFLLSAYCKSVIGVEKDKETIEHARKWFCRSNITYINDNKVPIGPRFHLISAFEVIEHHPDGSKLVKDFYDALVPNGILVVSVPNQDTVPFKQEDHEFHYRHYTSFELKELLECPGFKIELSANQPSKRFPELRAGFGGWTNLAVCRKVKP